MKAEIKKPSFWIGVILWSAIIIASAQYFQSWWKFALFVLALEFIISLVEKSKIFKKKQRSFFGKATTIERYMICRGVWEIVLTNEETLNKILDNFTNQDLSELLFWANTFYCIQTDEKNSAKKAKIEEMVELKRANYASKNIN